MNEMPPNRGMGILPMTNGHAILPRQSGMGILPMSNGHAILPMTTRAGFTAWKAVPRAKPLRYRRQRTGWTLIEVSIVVTISSIVFLLAATTLAALLRVKVQMAGDTEQDVSVARLASRLRTDAHEAVSAIVKDNALCELKRPDGRTVRYSAAPAGVVREIVDGGEIRHRDSFRLPKRAKVVFSSPGENGSRLLKLEILAADLPGQSYAIPARPLEILAAVNLHAQAAKAEATR